MLEAVASGRRLDRLLRVIEARYAAAGVPDARREARRTLEAAGVEAYRLLAAPDCLATPGQTRRAMAVAARRERREPLSRIAGERAFYGRDFHIGHATLDPRADTETLVEAALEAVRGEGWDRRPMRILDVGTGSGCLLVTLLAESPMATGFGTDIGAEALAVARSNAIRHGVAERARFALGRSLEGLDETFDLLVSNPPYVRSGDIANLEPEVREHDPRAALDGGKDGLTVYREMAPNLARVVPNGWALFEVGAGQADDAQEEIGHHLGDHPGHGWRRWTDLAGHERCIGLRIGL